SPDSKVSVSLWSSNALMMFYAVLPRPTQYWPTPPLTSRGTTRTSAIPYTMPRVEAPSWPNSWPIASLQRCEGARVERRELMSCAFVFKYWWIISESRHDCGIWKAPYAEPTLTSLFDLVVLPRRRPRYPVTAEDGS